MAQQNLLDHTSEVYAPATMNVKQHRYLAVTLYADGKSDHEFFSDFAAATAFARDVAEEGDTTFVYALADGGRHGIHLRH